MKRTAVTVAALVGVIAAMAVCWAYVGHWNLTVHNVRFGRHQYTIVEAGVSDQECYFSVCPGGPTGGLHGPFELESSAGTFTDYQVRPGRLFFIGNVFREYTVVLPVFLVAGFCLIPLAIRLRMRKKKSVPKAGFPVRPM